MLQVHPGGKARRPRRRRLLNGSRVTPDEVLHERVIAQTLGDGDQDDEQQERDRKQPQQVEPAATTDPHARRDPVPLRHRARPCRGVDRVLARAQLIPVAPHGVRRNACRPIGGMGPEPRRRGQRPLSDTLSEAVADERSGMGLANRSVQYVANGARVGG